MKRIFGFVLTLTVVLGLFAGCNGIGTPAATTPSQTTAGSTTEASTTEATTTEATTTEATTTPTTPPSGLPDAADIILNEDYQSSSLFFSNAVTYNGAVDMVVKKNDGNNYIRITHTDATQTLMVDMAAKGENISQQDRLMTEDFVMEMSLKLRSSSDYSCMTSMYLFQLFPDDNSNMPLANLGADGWVYRDKPVINGEETKIVKLSSEDWTRISILVSPSRNTAYYYVNGEPVLVDGVAMTIPLDQYKTIYQLRYIQAKHLKSGSYNIDVDDIRLYFADKPVDATVGAKELSYRAPAVSDGNPSQYDMPPVSVTTDNGGLLAFSGADGVAKNITGGRGGRVIYVTNLNDSGEGSLRAACTAYGPRIIAFKVAGVIELESPIPIISGDVTIAGQTAPGEVCLKNHGIYVSASNVIIRYLTVRVGNEDFTTYGLSAENYGNYDCIHQSSGRGLILDHISGSWAPLRNFAVSGDCATVQNCLLGEALYDPTSSDGMKGMAMLLRGAHGGQATVTRNLFASNPARNPRTGNTVSPAYDPVGFFPEFSNNVVYNWGTTPAGYSEDQDTITTLTMISNYYKHPVPTTGNSKIFRDTSTGAFRYLFGNMLNGVIPEDQRELLSGNRNVLDTQPMASLRNYLTAEETYTAVLADVGNNLYENAIDKCIIESVKNGTGAHIADQKDSVGASVGLWDSVPTVLTEKYTDTDGDGMADAWETANGLDPANAADGAKLAANGWTNLDNFLESLLAR